MNRKKIINQIIEEQKKVLSNLEDSIERYKTASDLDEESTHDAEDFSQQTQAKDMQLRYEKMHREALQNLTFLEKEVELVHDKIENGSVIETDKSFLFVGISVPSFEVENKEVITFSEQAPVFDNIKNKNINDEVKIGDKAYKILTFS